MLRQQDIASFGCVDPHRHSRLPTPGQQVYGRDQSTGVLRWVVLCEDLSSVCLLEWPLVAGGGVLWGL